MKESTAGLRGRTAAGAAAELAAVGETLAGVPTGRGVENFRPPLASRDVILLGVFLVFGAFATLQLLVRSAFSGETWRRSCRQCRREWWDEFWTWRLNDLAAAAANGTAPVPPDEGMEWEWGHAANDTDWFGASAELVQAVILQSVVVDGGRAKLLQIGCGDSPLPELLHKAGFRNVEHLDVSPRVVEAMRLRYPAEGWPGMAFEVRDFLADGARRGRDAAAVIDKAGIWDWLQEEKPSILPRLLEAVRSELRPEPDPGVYIVVTKQSPMELQRSLQGADSNFAVDAAYKLSSDVAWAYALVPF
mmetsp:Transcript_38185/g.105272  ORF Transcript_38185/g.105272 Transcript_38185/m.105272 type:complete len:304 (+) Transcript_38185:87-998(+)|eukprot:CAMPEP_0117533546 /NCGR_PEP_ID=MMETSP0784-20121206/39944_1 /TAXON_ID=39447 /ORGANISM="" /LENGTH=303 /DNA_ID=CAMNT_0005329983 /DNA_START=39 /DNA_END=950 /DNA_ORIENTATION=-